jgi:hypothetical protein
MNHALHFLKPYISEPSLQRCSYWLHNFHTQHTTVCECFRFLSPPLRIQLQLVVCNVCQTQTPFLQTTTAALSVRRPCTYKHVRNKHQCCYLSIFTLLSLFWNEKKMWGITFWATYVHKVFVFFTLVFLPTYFMCRGYCCTWPHSVGIPWMRDQSVAETYLTTQNIRKRQPFQDGIRTRNPSKRTAANVRPRGRQVYSAF